MENELKAPIRNRSLTLGHPIDHSIGGNGNGIIFPDELNNVTDEIEEIFSPLLNRSSNKDINPDDRQGQQDSKSVTGHPASSAGDKDKLTEHEKIETKSPVLTKKRKWQSGDEEEEQKKRVTLNGQSPDGVVPYNYKMVMSSAITNQTVSNDINAKVFATCPGYIANVDIENIGFHCWAGYQGETQIKVIRHSRRFEKKKISIQLPYMTAGKVELDPRLILNQKDSFQMHPTRKHMPLTYKLNVQPRIIDKSEGGHQVRSTAPLLVYDFFEKLEESLIMYACSEKSILTTEKEDAIRLKNGNQTEEDAIEDCVRSRFEGVFYPPRSESNGGGVVQLTAPMLDTNGTVSRKDAILKYTSLGQYFAEPLPNSNYEKKFNIIPIVSPCKTPTTTSLPSELVVRGDLVAPRILLTVNMKTPQAKSGRMIKLVAKMQYVLHIPCKPEPDVEDVSVMLSTDGIPAFNAYDLLGDIYEERPTAIME
jgi:hypothetical protein